MSDDLYAHFTQTTRFLQLTTTLGADRLLAECVRGEEAIGDGYSLSISALSLDANIRLRELLGKPALVEMLTVNQDARRVFHGHLTAVELLGSNGGMARYSLTLRPWTQFLALGRDSRVFHDMNVFDILDTVFKAWQGYIRKSEHMF